MPHKRIQIAVDLCTAGSERPVSEDYIARTRQQEGAGSAAQVARSALLAAGDQIWSIDQHLS